MSESENTTVFIEAGGSIGTVVLDTRGDSGVVIIGNEEISVVVDDSDLVASESPEPLNVTVTENPVTVILSTPELTVIGSNVPGPPGPAGPPGAGGGDADEIAYDNATYSTVQAALDALLYVAPHVNSFTNNRGTVEKGSSVASVTLAWSFNKAMTSVTLNGTPIDPASSSVTVEGPFTSNQTWTLQASDGTNSASASTSLVFEQKRYWGPSPLTSLDDADIIGLASEFATGFNKAVTYDCSGGAYPYLCYPASFGRPSAVTVGGLAFSDFSLTIQDFTNASGFTESYAVVRFNGIQTGPAIAVTWA